MDAADLRDTLVCSALAAFLSHVRPLEPAQADAAE
jgi:hypothetical protein